jgi:hypothetical protein
MAKSRNIPSREQPQAAGFDQRVHRPQIKERPRFRPGIAAPERSQRFDGRLDDAVSRAGGIRAAIPADPKLALLHALTSVCNSTISLKISQHIIAS